MSILTEPLPDYIIVCGNKYPVRSGFRVWLRLEEILNDSILDEREKILHMIRLCFDPKTCSVLPPSIDGLISGVMDFYNCIKTGSVKKGAEDKKGTVNTQRVFSYKEDAEYIYAAFYECYGIDLTKAEMHWWQFCALFKGLKEDTQLMKIIGYRSINPAEIEDKKRQSFYRKMKGLYSLSDNRTSEEKEGALAEALSKLI